MNFKYYYRHGLYRAASPRTLALAIAGFGLVAAASPVFAQSATAPLNLDLGSVLATGSTSGPSGDLVNTPGTAPYEAPSVTPLNSTQPTSVVTKHTMDKFLNPTQSYADAMRLTPSVNNISPNGPGLSETLGPSIRGFQDGQYNLTFDGIPIGDSNDFTHHSTSFFTNNTIGTTIVDRGPGTAETVGDATFGGTVSIRSIDPAPQLTLTPTGGYGSYNTSVEGLQVDTGAVQAANGSTAVFAAQHSKSDGALTYDHQERTNFFGKVVVPISDNTTLTFLADYNQIYQNPPNVGATLDEMAAFGNNFGYSNDPTQQNYWKYNNDKIQTDMEYADLTSRLGNGWNYDGKIYTYAYYHSDLNGDDPNDQGVPGAPLAGGVPNEVVLSPGGTAQPGVPGQVFKNDYRSVGTIQRIRKDFDWGDIKTGVWFDHQSNTRFVQNVSLTDGNAINFDTADSNGGKVTPTNDNGSIERLQHNQLYTFQPYAQVDYVPIENLTLTGGVKYAFFGRRLNAPVQQKTELQTGYSHDWGQVLPSFEAKYSFTPDLSAYAQVAEGFLAPNLNTFYTTNIASDAFKPETTWSYQTGTAYQDQNLALGADVYLVHFTNFINSSKDKFGNTTFSNAGGAVYKGLEGEATYTFDNGFSLFANAGLNMANLTLGNAYIVQAPQGTANAGLIYDKNGIYASAIDQWTGGEYGNNPSTSDNQRVPGEWYNPYNVVNLTLGYTFNHLTPHLSQISTKLNLDNITDRKQIIFDSGANSLGENEYFRLPGVSVFATVSVPLTF